MNPIIEQQGIHTKRLKKLELENMVLQQRIEWLCDALECCQIVDSKRKAIIEKIRGEK